MFSIDCLEIFDACDKSLRKNLIPGKFFFNNRYDEDGRQFDESLIKKIPKFWEDKINVQAIVGKNGSGKSTLLDLMYLIINNFIYMCGQDDSSDFNDLAFVPGLCASLSYSVKENKYQLNCHNYFVELCVNGNCKFRSAIKSEEMYPSIEEIKCPQSEILNDFFFSSISNFSIQSYLPVNYFCSKVYIHDNSGRGFPDKVDQGNWIEHFFHRNDGYKTPVVINPNRKDGRLNIWNLMHVSKGQAISLFIYAKKEKMYFFEPYEFQRISAKYNIGEYKYNIFRDYNNVFKYVKLNTLHLSSFAREDIEEFFENILKKKSVDEIIDFFNIRSAADTQYYKGCVAYLVLKIWKIVKTVPLYRKYQNYIEIEYDEFGCLNVAVSAAEDLKDLLEYIKQDSSYVINKIRRTINFLKLANGSLDYLESDKFFSIFENRSIFYNGEDITPAVIDSVLPPSIFYYELKLIKLDENKKPILMYLDKYVVKEEGESLYYYDENDNRINLDNKENVEIIEVDYYQLSSGQIQLIQTLAAHLYHIMNIISSIGSASQYKHFNLIFDEVEISFHPEYQRQFISRLISALTAMKVNSTHFVNIIIVTHSPFLLSDIPLKQILFLEDGTAKKKIMNTFAGNIGEMMYDSFFMKSTIGEFSEEKLKRIIRIRQGKIPKKNADGTYHNLRELPNEEQNELKNECEDILKMIGDSVIRSLVEEVSA